MTFSVLICSTRSFKDVFPSSELKKKKRLKVFSFSFFLSHFRFFPFFFPSKNSDMYSRVRVLYGFFFFFLSLNLHVCDFSVDRYLIYFSFFFFSFPHNFRNVFSLRFDIHEANIYIYSRERRRVSASTCGEITLLGFSKYRS